MRAMLAKLGSDDSPTHIMSCDVTRLDAIRDIDALMTAANDAYNEGVELRLVPVG